MCISARREARRLRRRSSAAVAITVALLVAACGSADPPRPDVALLPARGASSHVWRWTPQCPTGPAASKGCEAAGPVLGFAQLNGDEWNLGGPADAGSLDMSVGSAGAVTIKGLFTRTAACTESACLAPSAYTWVRGYPSVLYGVNQCHADTSPPKSPQLPLPMRLDSIPPHLIGVTAYSASTSQVTYDVAYDLWLHPTDTRRPCNSEGTLEIMVWTDYDARALLPAGMQVGTATIPSAVNGVARGNTQAWSIYASNIDRNGRTAPWGGTLWFVPDQADVVGHGRVSVDLSTVLLARPGVLLHDDYGWPELGRATTGSTRRVRRRVRPGERRTRWTQGRSRFSAQISAYCLDPGSTLDRAPC